MNTEIFGIIAMFGIALLLAMPFGKYMAKVYANEYTFLDSFLNPIERLIAKLCGINLNEEQNWKQHMVILLAINVVWFLLGMFVMMNQGWLPLNPDNNPSQSAHLAFNTIISFVVNCNLQHYSGESGLSYLGQLYLMFLQFVSAAIGMSAAVTLFHGLRQGTFTTLGNIYNFFIKSCTRILMPVSIVISVIFLLNGMPMTFEGKDTMISMQGDTTQVSRGPVAAFIPIKHLGTNGGGFFGSNSSHPFENPNYLTNMVEMIAQMLIPFAMVFAFGHFLKRKKLSWTIFGVMTVGFLLLTIPTIIAEVDGNSAITSIGIAQNTGNIEGKEMRFGAASSAYWSIATTVISAGSVNSMHDSFTPLAGMNQMLAMMVNALYGGVGVGVLNFFVFIILAVFISGLMVGRTPELFGKKVEAREVKIAATIAILHPLLILTGTALASHLASNDTQMVWWFDGKAKGWLNNPGYHGFSEMLYEFTSSAANNGSGFEGLGDNNPFWNITTGIVLLISRYLPIIGPVAIAGLLANKKYIPESAGTLKTDTFTFGIMMFTVIAIIAALSFFPALALGPLAEYFSMG